MNRLYHKNEVTIDSEYQVKMYDMCSFRTVTTVWPPAGPSFTVLPASASNKIGAASVNLAMDSTSLKNQRMNRFGNRSWMKIQDILYYL